MNCVIVDDDAFSTRIMSEFINRTSILNLVKTFNSAIDAIEFIAYAGNKIQLIFLDIEMPEMSGIDFMKSINLTGTQVVIYSSQQKYALESYEYNVADYLLKPVTYSRFIKAVARVKSELEMYTRNKTGAAEEEKKETEEEDGKVVLIRDSSGNLSRVKYSDIFYIESSENYVQVVTTQRKHIVHSTLAKFMVNIPKEYVVRVHRSFALGVRYIVGSDGMNINIANKTDKQTIPIGKTFKPELRKLLNSYCLI